MLIDKENYFGGITDTGVLKWRYVCVKLYESLSGERLQVSISEICNLFFIENDDGIWYNIGIQAERKSKIKERNRIVKNLLKRIGFSIYGLLQGTLGSYLALLGFAFAFPNSTPDSKDYEEDLFFVPLGYIIMLIWLVVMVTTFIFLRKNKANFLSFLIAWLVGLGGFLLFAFVIH